MHRSFALAGLALAGLVLAPASAQQNEIPGTDVSLGLLQELVQQGHQGPFPSGVTAVSMSTTSCNLGSVNVPWFATMEEDHPFIAFLLAREDDSGRFVQISDRSNVKHGFFALSNSQCIPCVNPVFAGNFLGVGCSDTYNTFNNAFNFELGPADEINPWLGTWDAECSFFDLGLNPGPGAVCDGNRSFTFSQANNLGPLGFRVILRDEDLNASNDPTFWYSSQYVVRGEPEANRENNLGSRRFIPTWNGNQWNFQVGAQLLEGSLLQRWQDATVTSEKNGMDDGRVYVGVKVTGPVDGLWHYEYALHNRDNARGIDGISVPVCAQAGIQNFGFRDIDNVGGNNWTATLNGGSVEIDGTGNALRWNSIYNFWFDSPAAPVSGAITLEEAEVGPGADQFAVPTTVPGVANFVATGPGCSVTTPGTLRTNGFAALGDPNFAILGEGVAVGAPTLVYASAVAGSLPIGSCTVSLGGLLGSDIFLLGSAVSDASGEFALPVPVPANPALEGVTLETQGVVITGPGGPLLDVAELTDGMRFVFGTPTGCL